MKQKSLAMEIFGEEAKPECRDAFEVAAIFLIEMRDARSAVVVSMRHGFDDGQPKTFSQIVKSKKVKAVNGQGLVVNRALSKDRAHSLYCRGVRTLGLGHWHRLRKKAGLEPKRTWRKYTEEEHKDWVLSVVFDNAFRGN